MPADQYVSFSAAWFTLSLINAGLAQGKGRRGFQWWLGSLLLGPIATLLIVAWPAVTPSASNEPAPDDMNRTTATIIGLVAVLAVVAIPIIVAEVVRRLGSGS